MAPNQGGHPPKQRKAKMHNPTSTSVTYEGKATLRAYYYESAHLYEEPASYIATLVIETRDTLISVKRIDCETAEEAWQYVEKWSRKYGLNDAY
jgi:hypothetical protein